MSTTWCQHGVAIRDSRGSYRCWQCAPADADDLSELRETIKELQETIKEHGTTIEHQARQIEWLVEQITELQRGK